MSLLPATSKKCYTPNFNKIKGAKEGKLYEIISLLTLASRGYELSKHENPKFRDFSVGREIGLGRERKLDDVVFSYVDEKNKKNLIFLQLKHYQYNSLIDSWILSTEADRAKDVAAEAKAKGLASEVKDSASRFQNIRYGNMCKDFNLQKYFISYLSVRDELKNTTTKELKDGKIKYVVLFTNNELDNKELEGKGFILKKAPDDIVNLFTLSSETLYSNQCYQLGDVSENLLKILKKSSDLDRLARELAQYVVCENYLKNRVMGNRETLIKYYHVALEREVIQKSPKKQVERGQYFLEAQFRDDFLDCDQTAFSLHSLRKALFEAIRELDGSKNDANDEELKRVLKEAKWKIVYNFEKSKENIKTNFPCEWIPVLDKDIKVFLRSFVFIVNQPRVTELELLYKHSIQYAVIDNPSMKQFIDSIHTTGPEFRDCVEKLFGLDIKRHDDEKWISGNQIEDFMKEKQQLLRIIFIVSAMTLIYKNEIRQYGELNSFGKIMENVKIFLIDDCKILCIKTPVTLLSSIKISQHFSREKVHPISIKLNDLNCTENRDYVLKAFELESIRLLMIECRHALKDHDYNFLYALVNIAEKNYNKKLVLIMQQEDCAIFTDNFKTDFEDKGSFVKSFKSIESDSIDLKDFKPKKDLLAKKVFVFQEQKEKVSLSDIIGINSWNSYIDNLPEENGEQGVIDWMTLNDILSNDKIEVGSMPPRTSSLEGAYAQTYEEINVETLVDKLTSQEHGNDANDVYVISEIFGSSKQDKTDKMIQYLGLNNSNKIIQDQLGDIGSEGKILIADDQFKGKDFHKLCHRYPKKRIFWISVKCENDVMNFFLQEIYNPKFYLKRKFRIAVIKKDLKQHLIKSDLSETFIFHYVEGKQKFYNSMKLNEQEIEQLENSCMIKVFFRKSDAQAAFRELSTKNRTVHFLELFEEQQFVWCEIFLIEENKLLGKIKDRKVVIFADDPGMGKTMTLIKLYETENGSSSIIKSNWVIYIKLRDHLEAVLEHDFEKDGIGIHNVIEFLSTVDLRLNNNVAKNLLKIVLDKSKSFQAKPLLLIFDGFDEVLDEVCRHRILLLLHFIKDKTAAKMWITTRCHFKKLLENKLSTIAIQFSPMDDAENAQYIATYLQHRLYLTLNKEIYTNIFDTEDDKKNNVKILIYTEAYINKMKLIFRGDISTFIGTPLQLYLMLEDTVSDFKIWIEEDGDQNSVFKYVCDDIWDVYECFIKRKYYVYFHKIGIREWVRQRLEKRSIDRYHKDLALSKILEINPKISFDEFKDIYLLVGVIKSHGNDIEFIHKTFEEFFVSKVFFDWITNVPETHKQEYLLKDILLKPDYQLTRAFINLQLQKMSEQSTKAEGQVKLDENSFKEYGNIAAELLNEKDSPLIDVIGTPLHIAVKENNKNIAWFLLKSLKGYSDALKKFLFTAGGNFNETALHLACKRDDLEIIKVLLDAAEGISENTLQEFLTCLNDRGHNALFLASRVAATHNRSFKIFNEMFSRANSKLDLILNKHGSALCHACLYGEEEFVDILLEGFKHEKHSLKKLLLYDDIMGNALCQAKSINIVQKLVYSAKLIEDNNETLKEMLLPEEYKRGSLNCLVLYGRIDLVEKLLNVAKEIDDENHTLKQLLLNERYITTPLHVAAQWGRGDIIKLLLKTAADLSIEILEKLITAVNKGGRNALQLMFDKGHDRLFDDSFKMLEEDKYENIRKKVTEMFDNVTLNNRIYPVKEMLLEAIEFGDIKRVKDILSNAKKSSISSNENVRVLLLADYGDGEHTIHMACEERNSGIIKELLPYSKDIDVYNHTLIQLLFLENIGRTALHVAASKGRGDIIKLLLETASDLGIEMLEKLITAVDEGGRNAIQLMFEKGHERIFDDSFKILNNSRYDNIRKKVMGMFDSVPPKSRLFCTTTKFITAIICDNNKEVKNILSNAKYSSNPIENLRVLLLDDSMMDSTLSMACRAGNSEIIKELLSYSVHMEDDGATLKKLLTKSWYETSPFDALKHGYTSEVKQIVESLIFEAKNNNRVHAASILEQIDNRYAELELYDISEESGDFSEESGDISEESDDISEQSGEISDDLNDILEELI